MSTALDTARKAAERAADALRTAEAKHADAIAGAQQRNTERRTAHWTRVLDDTLPAAQQAVQDTRTGFTEAVAKGGDIAGAYVAHVKAHAAAVATTNALCKHLVTFVNELTGTPNQPGDRTGRAVYPAGLSPRYDKPAPFVQLLEQAATVVAETHAKATLADLQSTLADQLEPEQ
jgi:hypothetical protein